MTCRKSFLLTLPPSLRVTCACSSLLHYPANRSFAVCGVLGATCDGCTCRLLEQRNAIVREARRLCEMTNKKTLNCRNIQAAVRLIIPGELAKHAVSEASTANPPLPHIFQFLACRFLHCLALLLRPFPSPMNHNPPPFVRRAPGLWSSGQVMHWEAATKGTTSGPSAPGPACSSRCGPGPHSEPTTYFPPTHDS